MRKIKQILLEKFILKTQSSESRAAFLRKEFRTLCEKLPEVYTSEVGIIRKWFVNDTEGGWLERLQQLRLLRTDFETGKINAKLSNGKLETFILIHGKDKGKLAHKEYQQKRKVKIDFLKSEKGWDNGGTLESYISRHGKDEGLFLWKEKARKQSERFSLNYYISKYGESEGKEKWEEYKQKMNKTSLSSYIKRYGEEDGTRRYNSYVTNVKKQGGITLERMVLKYGEEDGKIRYSEWRRKIIENRSKCHYSKISQKLFWQIFENLSEDLRIECKFAEYMGEQMVKIWKDNISVIFLDFKIRNIVIEFQGTYWHKFDNVKEKDALKLKHLQNYNYKVLYIEQKDFENQPLVEVAKCLEFIKTNII